MAGNKCRSGMLVDEHSESGDPGFSASVNQVWQRVAPEKIAAENYIRIGDKNNRIAASVTEFVAHIDQFGAEMKVESRIVNHRRTGEAFDRRFLRVGNIRAIKLFIFGVNPIANIFLRDNSCSRFGVDSVPCDVIDVVVRVDYVFHGKWSHFANFGEEGFGSVNFLETVDDCHAVVSNHESGIASRSASDR